MAALAVIPRPGKIKPEDLEAIVMDAVPEENHDLTNTITDSPVEKGADVTDHIRPDPDQITMKCMISNTPLSTGQQTRAVRRGDFVLNTNQEDRGQVGKMDGLALSGWKKLRKLRDDGAVVTVSTTLGDYTSMAIKSISAPRNAKNYDGLEFTITFRKIVIVENKLTRSTTTTDPSASNKKKTGAQTTKNGLDKDGKPTSAAFAQSDTASQSMQGSSNDTVKATGNAIQGFLHN